jgi:hypothetical protein
MSQTHSISSYYNRLAVALLLAGGAIAPPASLAATKTVPGQSIPNVIDWPGAADPKNLLPPREAWIDSKRATVYLSYIPNLLEATVGTCRGYDPPKNGKVEISIHKCAIENDATGKPTGKKEVPNFPGPNDYVILHLVAWKDPAKDAKTQDVDKQNWYVYNGAAAWDDAAFTANYRIFGKKNVYLFYLHLNRAARIDYNVNYEMVVASKFRAFLDHLIKLGQIWGVTVTGAGGPSDQPSDVFGMITYKVDYVPSDLTVTPKILDAGDGHTGTTLDSKKFDNEGTYHTDFSVAVPIKKITDFMYVSTSSSLAPAKVDKQKLLAVFDFHPWSFDVKGSGFSKYPYLLTGVGLGSKPLQRTLFGVAYGPAYANFYAGLLLNTQHLPEGGECGKTPTAEQLKGTLTTKTCKEFTFGINVGVGSILDAIKNSNSKSGQTPAAK